MLASLLIPGTCEWAIEPLDHARVVKTARGALSIVRLQERSRPVRIAEQLRPGGGCERLRRKPVSRAGRIARQLGNPQQGLRFVGAAVQPLLPIGRLDRDHRSLVLTIRR